MWSRKFSLKIDSYTKVEGLCADMDADATVSLKDAQKILRKALKIDWNKRYKVYIVEIICAIHTIAGGMLTE